VAEGTFYEGLLIVWFALSGVTFVVLWWLPAPYGRHVRPGWGPTLPSRLGWVLMELPSALVMAACFAAGVRDAWTYVFLGLWELHYLYRSLVYPFRRRGAAKPMPLTVIALGAAFNIGNAYLNGRGLTAYATETGAGWSDPRFLAGVVLFFAGFAINIHSDEVLRRLRGSSDAGYQIPRGGFYRFVSCPNYFGEIVEWLGWAIAAATPAGWAFALWTAANLVPRARTHHAWYRRQFSEYPRERRAVIPLLF
jgi:3-oxo-5-alpha-steroid 4-dehydrogenase 1